MAGLEMAGPEMAGRDMAGLPPVPVPGPSEAERRRTRGLVLLRRVRDRIDRCYAEPLDVPGLAREVGLSAGHLSREFKRAYGESPYSYLMTRRVERAMTLLRRGDLTVTEVCFAVGYGSLGTFSTRFSELVGCSPSEYRARAAVDGLAGHLPGAPACLVKQATRPVRGRAEPVRNGEAPAPGPH